MPAVLFVCRENQFRSPIAAACLRQIIRQDFPDEHWVVGSAGTWAENGLRAPKLTLDVAQKYKLSGLKKHISRQVTTKLLASADLVIVMEIGQKEALRYEFQSAARYIYQITEIVEDITYDIGDLNDSRISSEDIGDTLIQLISRGSPKILELARKLHSERNSIPK